MVYLSQITENESAENIQKAKTDSRFLHELQQKYSEWLLRRACADFFGKPAQELNLRKLPNGKWVLNDGFCSVSHSGFYVVVALSRKPVGIDLQKCAYVDMRAVATKFFTARELQNFQNAADKTDEFFFTWCKKEALWKSLKIQPQTVASAETVGKQFTQKKLTLNGETYYLVVTGKDKSL